MYKRQGKSTRLPLWLLAAPWLRQHDKQGRILLLEPRRVAARALARYLARALDEDVGRTVGLRMRDETRVSHATKLEVLTEGVLTRLLQADPQLTDTACVILTNFMSVPSPRTRAWPCAWKAKQPCARTCAWWSCPPRWTPRPWPRCWATARW